MAIKEMNELPLFPQTHPQNSPRPLRDLSLVYKGKRNKYVEKYRYLVQRIENLINNCPKDHLQIKEQLKYGTCRTCHERGIFGKPCQCCEDKTCFKCLSEVKIKMESEGTEKVNVKIELCGKCINVFESMKEGKYLLRVFSQQHYNVKLRESVINATQKTVSVRQQLNNATEKNEIVDLCQLGLKTIKEMQKLIDSVKKENHQFESKSDAVVASNILKAVSHFNGTFGFCLIGEIDKKEKRVCKPLPLPVIKSINCGVIPICGGQIKIGGVGITSGIVAYCKQNKVDCEFKDGVLCVTIPPSNFHAIGESVGIELFTNDNRKIPIPNEIIYCDF